LKKIGVLFGTVNSFKMNEKEKDATTLVEERNKYDKNEVEDAATPRGRKQTLGE
jgi:hypothetical protein